jgi:predicted ATPase
MEFDKHVTFLIWENGTWKSTLLEAIAVNYGFNPEGWSKNFSFSTEQTHSILHQHIKLTKWITRPKDWYFLRAESFYNVASNIDELDTPPWGPKIKESYGWKPLHKQSHWESFFSLFMNRFYGNGIYLLDEPEAALSPQKQIHLLKRMKELINQKSQFIIATHSPILLAYPNAKIVQLSDEWYKQIEYTETQNYKIYRDFLENPERIIKAM